MIHTLLYSKIWNDAEKRLGKVKGTFEERFHEPDLEPLRVQRFFVKKTLLKLWIFGSWIFSNFYRSHVSNFSNPENTFRQEESLENVTAIQSMDYHQFKNSGRDFEAIRCFDV